jgi:hypothetical protein
MKKLIAATVFVCTMLFPANLARADLFGGDIAVLANILVQTIQQLNQLRQIFQTGTDQLNMMRDLNRGINDSLLLLRTVAPSTDPGIFRELEHVSDAMRVITEIYGQVVPSKDAPIQASADQSVAEAVALNNSIYAYTREIDEIGEAIKSYSHTVSPGGAQKLTAESLGVMLHVMNQGLRAQATSLKIQAQVLAAQNHKDKEASRETLATSEALTAAIEKKTPQFETPRF